MSKTMTYSTFKDSPLSDLQPALFWQHFYELTRIPRASRNEKAVGDYVVSIAEKHKVPYKRDEAGNVVICKPGSPGHENSPVVILQSHLDMVCEKNKDVAFDFDKDPIILKRDGDFITADGTSLGADNGVGIAASLTLLESGDLVHPPLELLFTIDEETGMTGAKTLHGDFLKGRRLMNLDSEEEGAVYVGCAGGSDNLLEMAVKKISPPGPGKTLKIKLEGLKGGHSGLDIHTGRGNAIKLLGRFLWNCLNVPGFHLVSLHGGSKRNAIPREADASIYVEATAEEKIRKLAVEWEKIFLNEYTPVEEKLTIIVEPVSEAQQIYSVESTKALLNLIYIIPHGVLSMSRSIADLVETSTNLAIINDDGDKVVIELSHRSSSQTARDSVDSRTAALAQSCGLKHKIGEGYPGWQPDMNSEVLKVAQKTYKELFKKDIAIKAIHAGLECGLIGEKFPGMDMISFGPTLANVHSPDEVINIPSVEPFWKFLTSLLKALA